MHRLWFGHWCELFVMLIKSCNKPRVVLQLIFNSSINLKAEIQHPIMFDGVK